MISFPSLASEPLYAMPEKMRPLNLLLVFFFSQKNIKKNLLELPGIRWL